MIIFKAFLLYKKFTNELRRAFVGKKKLHLQNYSFDLDKLPKVLPRVIWMFWDGPLETAPTFIKYAIDSWKKKNPKWDVRVLSDASLLRYIDCTYLDEKKKIQGRSDAIRLALLERHGGVWVDASCSCLKPLDDWLPVVMQSGFFAFPDTHPGRIVQTWFLAAAPGNHLVREWSRLANRYYSRVGKPPYFWVFFLFEYLTRTDLEAARVWEFTPKISAKGEILLKRIITQRALAELIPSDVDLNAVPMLKISTTTKSEDPEFVEAIAQGREIDLRKMSVNAVSRRK